MWLLLPLKWSMQNHHKILVPSVTLVENLVNIELHGQGVDETKKKKHPRVKVIFPSAHLTIEKLKYNKC